MHIYIYIHIHIYIYIYIYIYTYSSAQVLLRQVCAGLREEVHRRDLPAPLDPKTGDCNTYSIHNMFQV